jgi:hypothetical protein
MFRLKLLIILFVLGGLSLFYLQNREPLSLKLLCSDVGSVCLYQTPPLPVAAWILLFLGAGVFTSLLLQILNNLSRGARRKTVADNYSATESASFSSSQRSPYNREESYYRSSDRQAPETFSSGDRQQSSYNPQDRATSTSTSTRNFVEQVFDRVQARIADSNIDRNANRQPDWNNTDNDDWNLEEPPKKSTSSRDSVERSLKEEELKQESTDYETQQTPKSVERSGSVYSYKFREAGEPKDSQEREQKKENNNKVDRVYDANYRLINPPFQPPSQSNQPPSQPSQERSPKNQEPPKPNNEDDEDWV